MLGTRERTARKNHKDPRNSRKTLENHPDQKKTRREELKSKNDYR